MMRNFRRDRLVLRFVDWQARLDDPKANRKRAVDLYCGNSWSVIRSLWSDVKIGKVVRFWIVSAGHGLVRLDDALAPYAATFAAREADAVIPPKLAGHAVSEWWDLLVNSRRKRGVDVACIADIAKLHPDDPLIAAVSSDYLRAISQDLKLARSKMKNADRMVIIAAGARKDGDLADNFLPCDARLEHHLGRSRMALNARILRLILLEFSPKDITATRLKAHFEPLLSRLPKAAYPERKPSDDQTVCSFIRKTFIENKGGHYTNFLRLYRATGRACEQRRFRKLFRRVVNVIKMERTS